MSKIEAIVSRIKQLREKNRLSQKEFGEIIGFSQGNIGNWERGRSRPSIKAIIAIVKKFNVSSDWLLLGEDTPTLNPLPLVKELNQQEIEMLNTYLEFLLFKRQKKQPIKDCSFTQKEDLEKSFFNDESGK